MLALEAIHIRNLAARPSGTMLENRDEGDWHVDLRGEEGVHSVHRPRRSRTRSPSPRERGPPMRRSDRQRGSAPQNDVELENREGALRNMIHKVCGDRLSKNATQAIKTYIKEFEEGVLQKLNTIIGMIPNLN